MWYLGAISSGVTCTRVHCFALIACVGALSSSFSPSVFFPPSAMHSFSTSTYVFLPGTQPFLELTEVQWPSLHLVANNLWSAHRSCSPVHQPYIAAFPQWEGQYGKVQWTQQNGSLQMHIQGNEESRKDSVCQAFNSDKILNKRSTERATNHVQKMQSNKEN